MKINIQKLLFIFLLPLVLSSCFDQGKPQVLTGKVAILFPIDDNVPRWALEEGLLTKRFSEANFYVGYARTKDGDVDGQINSIKFAQEWGFTTIVFVSVNTDSDTLAGALEKYVKWGGKVLCYDRLQRNTDAVSAFVAPSTSELSQLHYDACKDMPEGSTFEFLAGPKTDYNAKELFDGLYSRMSDKIQGGYWVSRSGNLTYDKLALSDWGSDQAYVYINDILNTYYSDGVLPTAILAVNDAQAEGVALALDKYALTHGVAPCPIITGMDKTDAALIRIVMEKQTMTIDKNPIGAIDRTFDLIKKLYFDEKLDLIDKVNNGLVDVPFAKVAKIQAIYKSNIN